jgi:hypothetical protein
VAAHRHRAVGRVGSWCLPRDAAENRAEEFARSAYQICFDNARRVLGDESDPSAQSHYDAALNGCYAELQCVARGQLGGCCDYSPSPHPGRMATRLGTGRVSALDQARLPAIDLSPRRARATFHPPTALRDCQGREMHPRSALGSTKPRRPTLGLFLYSGPNTASASWSRTPDRTKSAGVRSGSRYWRGGRFAGW